MAANLIGYGKEVKFALGCHAKYFVGLIGPYLFISHQEGYTFSMSILNKVKVREATPADDERLGELLIDAFVNAYAQKMPEVVVSDRRKAELRDVASRRARSHVLVAEIDGVIVGTVTVVPPGVPASEAWLPNAADIRQLAIDIKFQGQGLATPLLDVAEAVARSWKADYISLHVRRGAHGVARVYMNRGYLRAPEGDLDFLPEVFLEAYVLKVSASS